MDAPAMLTRKHVPEDVGLRNDEAAAGGQGQLHRDEKEHKPVLKKVKDKVKKIKSTLTGHGHSHGHGGGDDHGADERMGDAGVGSTSSEEGEDVAEREAALEKGGYMEDVEDKPVLTESDPVGGYMDAVEDKPVLMESDPEVHGAPMYQSERSPAVQDLVAKYDPAARAPPAVQEREGHGAPGVRLGDLGGHVVEDPAAPRTRTPAAREGEDIGTTPVVKQFENMNLSDDPAHVGAGKEEDSKVEEWKDAAADKIDGTAGGASYTDKLKNAAMGTTEYGKKLASTVYEKVAGGGTAVGAGNRDDERVEAVPASNVTGVEEPGVDAPAGTDATNGTSGVGYTDKIKSAAMGTTQYGKQLASTAYEKVAGAGTAVGAGKHDDERVEAVPASNVTGVEERGVDAPAATDATNGTSGAGYTDKIKSAAMGTTQYGKQLASTAYEKVAGVAPNLRPQVGAAKPDDARSEAMPVSDDTTGMEEEWKDAPAPATMDTTTNAASGPGYTDKIKSAAVGTTEYGKQLATTVYEKVAGVGTAVAGKVQQATPGVGAQQQPRDTNATAGGQDKGVTVTGYIAEKLRPGDEDRALSEAISGAVQRRKEDVGGTVAQRVPAPGQVITKAREAVTSLTGGNRVSETVQPSTATGEEVKEGYAAEAPVIRGEDIDAPRLNTNTM